MRYAILNMRKMATDHQIVLTINWHHVQTYLILVFG
jgi:hypothetical protein